MYDTPASDHQCISGTHCRGYDNLAKHPAWTDPGVPLCGTCLAFAARDVGTLLFDWYDLEQQQLPSLSQAINPQPGARRDPPMPLRGEPEALQREIHHVLTTWETVVREAAGLADLPPLARHGSAVQRAVSLIQPRLRLLASLPATPVYPTGCEDEVVDVTGWEAVHHLQRLRARARSMLGWTYRSRWVPGDCWSCEGRDADPQDGPLYRVEPRYAGDESLVYCDRCGLHRTADDYDVYLTTLLWPGQAPPEPTSAEPTTADTTPAEATR